MSHRAIALVVSLALPSLAVAQQPPPYPPPPPAYPPPQPVYPAQPGYPPPSPYYYPPQPVTPMRTVYQPRWGLFIGGTSVFLVAYLLDVGITYAYEDPEAHLSLVPVIGPFLQMNSLWQRAGKSGSAFLLATYGTVGLVWDFIAQAAGLTMGILGITLWTKKQVYAGDAPARLTLTPGAGGAGFALTF